MPGTQLHKSKEKNNDQDSNERSNQNSNRKRQPNDHARIQPLSRHGIATKIAPEKNQDNKKYSNQSSKKNGNQNHNANPGPGNNPSLLDKTIVLGPQNEVRKAYQKPTPWARSSPVPAMCLWSKRTCSQASYSGMTFLAVTVEKKRAMWTPNWGLKSGPRFGAREKKKQFGGPQNGVQISHPILGPTLPIIFREVTPEKITFWIEFLWAGSLSWQPHVLAQFLQCACEANEPAQASYSGMTFLAVTVEKKRAMWTPNWGLKSGPRFGAREKKKQFGGPQNGVQISHPILGPTLPIIFREVTPEKITFWIEFLWAGSLSWQPHVLALGRTLLRVLVFGTLFSPHFGVQRQSLFSKETMLKPCVG